MRLSVAPFVAALAFRSVTSASIPAIDKIAKDIATFSKSFSATPLDIGELSDSIQRVIADTVAFATSAEGNDTGSSLTPANATAIVSQITRSLCPSLSSVKEATSAVAPPSNSLSLVLTSATNVVVKQLRTLLKQLPEGVDVTGATACLDSISPPPPSTKVARAGGATIPVAT